ncbi:2-oxoglutarate and iron-dependent oxygenase domain-containing protein 3, partial [Bienertia sinuspersici]
WNKGASIGWHSDDNRPYLQQRDFTAVCYLNNCGEDFSGGVFHFQDGEPANYVPKAGDLVLYSADSRNIHSVDEIIDGERLTLTLWFSRSSSFDEDAKLISLLSPNILDNNSASCIPLPAPSNMYWYSLDQGFDHQRGYDIHFARLFVLGYDIYSTQGKVCSSEKHFLDRFEVFNKPLKLVRGDKLYTREFANLLHALQVVLFYYWKQSVLQRSEVVMDTGDVKLLSEAQKEVIHELRSNFLSTMLLERTIYCYSSSGKNMEFHFDWACFSAAVKLWEEYSYELYKQLQMHLPIWKDYQSLFAVSSLGVEE